MLQQFLNWWNGLSSTEDNKTSYGYGKNKHWIATLEAAYVDEKDAALCRWRYLTFVDDEGNRSVECSLNKSQLRNADFYGGVWNHCKYTNVIVPWLHGCVMNTKQVTCYNNHPDFDDHFIKNNSTPKPDITPKPSATILRLVQKETEPPQQ